VSPVSTTSITLHGWPVTCTGRKLSGGIETRLQSDPLHEVFSGQLGAAALAPHVIDGFIARVVVPFKTPQQLFLS
jgi:hypothetical protein